MTRELSVRAVNVSLAVAVVVTVFWTGALTGAATCALLVMTR